MRSSEVPALKPTVYQERCSRVRFSGASCNRCLRCPADAIKIAYPALTIDDTCSGCGFCAALCPNEVFTFPEKSTMRFTNDEEQAGPIYCSGLLAAGPLPVSALPSSVIPCLGSISTGLILARVLRDKKPLEVITGICEECSMKAGETIYRQKEREIGSLFDYLGIGYSRVRVSAGSATDRQVVSRLYRVFQARVEQSKPFSRRDFFKHVRDSLVIQSPQPTRDNARTSGTELTHQGPTTETRLLVEFFSTYAGGVNGQRGAVPMCTEIEADETCTGCGACARLCPSAALTLDQGPAEVQLRWTPAHCSLCNLCLDVCPRKALHTLPCLDAGRITGQTTSTVKVFQRHLCQACGNSFLSSGSDGCCSGCSKTENLMDELSLMIYGDTRRTAS